MNNVPPPLYRETINELKTLSEDECWIFLTEAADYIATQTSDPMAQLLCSLVSKLGKKSGNWKELINDSHQPGATN